MAPTSDLHTQQSTEELKKLILALEQLPLMSSDISKALEWDLQIALKGIVQERAPPKKKFKPELVIDDDGDDDEYYY